jgi:hypothetical protein
MPAKQLDLSSLSEAEKNERLAAAVTPYGVGTRSHNRSAEKREINRQRAEATAAYLARPRQERKIELRCRCRSFELAHPISRHRELAGEWDWRLESERCGVEYRQEGIR